VARPGSSFASTRGSRRKSSAITTSTCRTSWSSRAVSGSQGSSSPGFRSW
jgi:hypothetical protein